MAGRLKRKCRPPFHPAQILAGVEEQLSSVYYSADDCGGIQPACHHKLAKFNCTLLCTDGIENQLCSILTPTLSGEEGEAPQPGPPPPPPPPDINLM